jgi:hypothetical protein
MSREYLKDAGQMTFSAALARVLTHSDDSDNAWNQAQGLHGCRKAQNACYY